LGVKTSQTHENALSSKFELKLAGRSIPLGEEWEYNVGWELKFPKMMQTIRYQWLQRVYLFGSR
jgi:hypothetical protein